MSRAWLFISAGYSTSQIKMDRFALTPFSGLTAKHSIDGIPQSSRSCNYLQDCFSRFCVHVLYYYPELIFSQLPLKLLLCG